MDARTRHQVVPTHFVGAVSALSLVHVGQESAWQLTTTPKAVLGDLCFWVGAFIRKVWVSMKFLSANFGPSPPPPKRAQNEEKLYKSVENPQNLTLFREGGGMRFYGQNVSMDIWAFLILAPWSGAPGWAGGWSEVESDNLGP